MSDEASENKAGFAQKAAWALLVVAVAGLMGAAIYKKMNPPEPRLGENKIEFGKNSGSSAPQPEDLFVWGEVGDFKLMDQAGKPMEAKDLRGEPYVANFIFTRCAGTCPQMTRAMRDLDQEIIDLEKVKLISFTMDPEFDTPEVLAKYAQKSGASSPRWKFLTGDKDQIYRLTRDKFQLVTKPNPEDPVEPIMHSSLFILVDGEGKIRGRFGGLTQDGPNLESMKLLAKSIRKLRALSGKDAPKK